MVGLFREFFNIKNNVIHSFKQQAGYLLPGRYLVNNTLTLIYHENDPEGFRKAQSFFSMSRINLLLRCLLLILKLCCFRDHIVIEKSKALSGSELSFCGTVCTIGIARSFGRIFDFGSSRVLTFYSDADEYQSVISNYTYFRRYFPLPKMFCCNNQRLITVEEYIESKPVRLWTENELTAVVRDVFSRYIEYFSDITGKHNNLELKASDLLWDRARKYKINKLIISQTKPELLEATFPYVRIHGDLWPPNILLNEDNTELKYIDFEMSGSYIFFYDILWFLSAYAFIYNDFSLFGKYLSGEYDGYLDACFKACGAKYKPECKLDYMNIFFLNYSASEWSKGGRSIRIRHYLQYRRFLKKTKTYMRKSCYG